MWEWGRDGSVFSGSDVEETRLIPTRCQAAGGTGRHRGRASLESEPSLSELRPPLLPAASLASGQPFPRWASVSSSVKQGQAAKLLEVRQLVSEAECPSALQGPGPSRRLCGWLVKQPGVAGLDFAPVTCLPAVHGQTVPSWPLTRRFSITFNFTKQRPPHANSLASSFALPLLLTRHQQVGGVRVTQWGDEWPVSPSLLPSPEFPRTSFLAAREGRCLGWGLAPQ